MEPAWKRHARKEPAQNGRRRASCTTHVSTHKTRSAGLTLIVNVELRALVHLELLYVRGCKGNRQSSKLFCQSPAGT